MRPTLRLTPKVTLAFALFAVVLVVGLGLLAYNSGRSSLIAATFSELLSISVEKEAAFNAWTGDSLSRITALAGSSRVVDSAGILLGGSDEARTQEAQRNLLEEMRLSLGENSPFTTLLLLNPRTGRIIVATDPDEEGHFQEDQPFFINGQEKPFLQTVYYSLESQTAAMAVSAPIKSEDGQLLGVLAGRLNLANMGSIINRHADYRQTDDAFLVNPSNLYVTQPRFMTDSAILQRGLYTDPIKNCLQGIENNQLGDDYRGVPSIMAYTWLPEQKLCLVVKIDQAEAFLPVQQFGSSLALIGAGLLIASIGIAGAVARTITHPILKVQEGVAKFGKGDLTIRLPETSHDELGVLARQFNTMAESIAEQENQLQNYARHLETRVDERTARLAFLAEASELLSESFNFESCLQQLARSVVPEIADWCAVDVVSDDQKIDRIAVVHSDPEKAKLVYEIQRRFPPDPTAEYGTYYVLRTGQTEMIHEVTDAMFATITDEEQLVKLRTLGLKSVMTIPLMAHGRALGTITLAMAESDRRFDMADRELAEDLARRAGLLIDNAKLYAASQKLNAELEQRVTDRTAQLLSANKELEAFSYSVSHDLRAPLRALDGFSNALQEDYANVLDDDGKDFLNRIRSASQRMGELIDDMLALSRLTRTEMQLEQVNLTAISQQIATTLCESNPTRQVTFDIQPTPTVRGDARLLRAMLENLLSNAWKFTAKRANARIEFGMQRQGETQVYYVRDNGAGFDMAYADKLFGAFQRLHKTSEFEGTGIGLATVFRIMQRHGGRIWAEGTVDKGATFFFSFDSATQEEN